MPSLSKLQAEFKSALAEAEGLKSNNERTPEQSVRLKSLANEILPGLQSQITDEQEAEKVNLDEFKSMGTSMSTPYPTYGKPSGQVHIDSDGNVEYEGPHSLTQKQYDKLREPAYKRAFKTYFYEGENYVKERRPSIYKTLVAGIDESAGYFIPPEMMSEIIRREPAPTTLAGRVRTITTSAPTVKWNRTTYRDSSNIYTSPINGQWTGEGADPGASPEPLYGEVSIDVHEYMGKWSISKTALADSGRDLEAEFSYELGIWAQLHFEKFLAYGTGIGQPQGLWNSITSSGTGVPELGGAGWVETTVTGKFDPDTLKTMRFEIPLQYQRSDFSFIMNQQAAKGVALLKNTTDGNYLFHRGQVYPGIVEPTPDQIDGFPITYCQFAPDVATGNYAAIFGSLKGYIRPVRQTMSVQVLNEIEALKGRRVYMFSMRWGGKLVQEQFHKFIKIK
jgi:HK97 family phage major capsid protein